jgi:BCD family chlorophyll transporter-like MFS transporter
MLTVGIVVGAILISVSLRSLDQIRDPQLLEATLRAFMARVALVVMALVTSMTSGPLMRWAMNKRKEGLE